MRGNFLKKKSTFEKLFGKISEGNFASGGERSRNFLEKVSRALQKLSNYGSRAKTFTRHAEFWQAPAARRHHILLALTHFASGGLKTFREKFLRISKAFEQLRGLKRLSVRWLKLSSRSSQGPQARGGAQRYSRCARVILPFGQWYCRHSIREFATVIFALAGEWIIVYALERANIEFAPTTAE